MHASAPSNLINVYLTDDRSVSVILQAVIADESYQNVSKLSFKISLARPALKFNEEAILGLYSGESPVLILSSQLVDSLSLSLSN